MQMMLLYFEYTKQYQETTIDQIFKEEFRLDSEISEKEHILAKSKKNITKLKLQLSSANKELKKIKLDASKKETVYACLYCTGKAFISIPLLEAHYQRHHIDKFEKPKQNFQETLLTVQTLLLQQQINSMINNQNQQDFMLQTMQQAQFMQQQAEDSDSSQDEDLEDEKMDDYQMRQLKYEFEQKNLVLQQQMESLQNYIAVHRPQEILDKIEQIEYRIDNLKIPEPVKVEERLPTPPPENYSYNAGPLEDEISEIADDIYDAKDLQQEIKEDVTNDSKSDDDQKEPSVIIDNQQEAAFLQEEKEFHHMVKSVRQKKSQITKELTDHFRNIQLDNELERKLKEVLNVNMNEIQFKSEKELEEYLTQLNGTILLSDKKQTETRIADPELEEIKKHDGPNVIQMDSDYDNDGDDTSKVQQQKDFKGRLVKKQGKTVIEQSKNVRFQQIETPPSSQSNNSEEEYDINQKVKENVKDFKQHGKSSKQEPQQLMKIQSENKIRNSQDKEQISQILPLEKKSSTQSQQQKHQQQQQQQQQQQHQQQQQQQQLSSKRKSSFEDSEEFQTENIQTIFQTKKPAQISQFGKSQESEIPLHQNVIRSQQQKSSIIKKQLYNDSEDEF
ncbi:unnamed protein product (macronuclear) [Paramecium tetraurelia]|uniref:C2H2-type domain-containing protein n=1 Tax=Paramecium tetraurelia TaxID=5888 RepID=A0BRW3_PARTE|nr:uncharacterized protein GSPATT00031511001 [Paramecium tetraurelia]CAK61280.1 unnamed protein product [Paramecium tetraurelia]|eukprot:XP_001428678.1 hypothetical protein (macronuclear) [Paramecium tetraurelia strain d4-2]